MTDTVKIPAKEITNAEVVVLSPADMYDAVRKYHNKPGYTYSYPKDVLLLDGEVFYYKGKRYIEDSRLTPVYCKIHRRYESQEEHAAEQNTSQQKSQP